jgi:DNA-binding transcriptional ArsR family regulator
MTVTIDVTGLAPNGYVFAPSPLAELGAALHLLVEPGHHPAQAAQTSALSAAVGPELRARLHGADFLWRTSRADMLLPAHPAPTLAQELDAVDLLDDETWADTALITSCCGSLPVVRELHSPLVDPRARDLARERGLARGPRQLEFVDRVLDDTATVRAEIRILLEDCATAFFDQAWQAVVAHLTADARLKTDLMWTRGLDAALSAVSPAVGLDASGSRIVVDKLVDSAATARGQGVTFLPTIFGDPHLLVVHAPGWQPVIQYPIATLATTPPTWDDVQRRLRALDHPVRLRLGRSLVRGPHTTGELAELWDLTAPEVSRHLAVLKEAGLVTTTRHGRYVSYQLDVAAASRLGTDIVDAMLR